MQVKSYHHFMVAGQVVFSKKDEPQVHVITLNAILTGESTPIPIRAIGKAQQAVQMQFYERMQDPTLVIRDVVIVSFMYLGDMTEEEFKEPPEGTAIQPKDPDAYEEMQGTNIIEPNPFH